MNEAGENTSPPGLAVDVCHAVDDEIRISASKEGSNRHARWSMVNDYGPEHDGDWSGME